jgi:multidrug efflux pump subunit AcrA (membrane-fusion protein)
MPTAQDVQLRLKNDNSELSSAINLHLRAFGEPARPPVSLFFAALTGLLLLAGCDAKPTPAVNVERPVQVQRVAFSEARVAHEFSGIVRARYETDLGFRVAGKIAARFLNAGDRVHIGDPIARLDPRDLALQEESAAAELTAATSNLEQAAADLDRYAALRARGFASVADFDRKKAAKDEASGRVERARRAVELARNQLAYADLKADAEGSLRQPSLRRGRSSASARLWSNSPRSVKKRPSLRCLRAG